MSKQDKRRIINIGPGLIIAIVISIVIVGMKYVKMEKKAAQQRATPPIIERHVVSTSGEGKLGLTPEVEFIIERSSKLGLSSQQLSELRKLQSEWEKIYGPKLKEASDSASETSEYLAGAKDNRKTPVAQINDQAKPLVALSGEISAARRRYWNRANEVLTPDQRKMVQKEREAAWAAKVKVTR